MCIAARISLTSLQWCHCLCSAGVAPFVAMVPAQSRHHLHCIVIYCIVSCLFHHIAVLGKFTHRCNVALPGGLAFLGKVTILGKVAILASLPSWQFAIMEILQSLANFPHLPQCCLVIVHFLARLPFLTTLPPLAREATALLFALAWPCLSCRRLPNHDAACNAL
jgi:hypothetical protein